MSFKASSSRMKVKRRSKDAWVSNNRVLNGGNNKKGSNVARNPNFDTEETKLLIQLWGDPKVQRTLITTHKKHSVICQLAVKMQNYGYFRSAEEITTRIKNLKCFYNRLKKDMEISGIGTEPSWKHFAEMDAIMTRPIFSVRPNEVPAPSLKYQLEKKKEERAERKRKALEDGSTLSESEDDDSDDLVALSCLSNSNGSPRGRQDMDDGIIPDVEIDIDETDEAFVVLANVAEKTMHKTAKRRKAINSPSERSSQFGEGEEFLDEDGDENRLQIKEEIDAEENDVAMNVGKDKMEESVKSSNMENDRSRENASNSSACNEDTNDSCVALVIPKDEPIDVDADEDDDDEGFVKNSSTVENPKTIPILGNMFKLQNNNLVAISSAGNILIPVSSITTTNSSNAKVASTHSIVTSTASSSTTATSAAANIEQLQQGKISLVPTNFLMHPKTTCTSSALGMTPPALTMSAQSLQSFKDARILLSSNSQSKQKIPSQNTGIVTTGAGGMKVLLVNADQATGGKLQLPSNITQQISTTNLSLGNAAAVGTVLPLNSNTTTLLQQQQQRSQHQHINVQQQLPQHQVYKRNIQLQEKNGAHQILKKKMVELDMLEKRQDQNKREVTGMRLLLRQLLNSQSENNELQKQRLALERERFEFEKSTVERFFSSLPGLLSSLQQPQQQQQSQTTQQFVLQHPKTSAQLYHQNLSAPTQLRLNPPKLVFATGALTTPSIATSSATISNVSSTGTILTASFPKVASAVVKGIQKPAAVEICSPITNDMPLLTPKVENED